MERGFHAFSYQDISSALGVRNAAVHYHFRTKVLLVAAVVERYPPALPALGRRATSRSLPTSSSRPTSRWSAGSW